MPELTIYEPGQYPELFAKPSILLSASVPHLRNSEGPDGIQLTEAEIKQNQLFFESRHPDRIRRAITELCRRTLRRDWNLVFGGHPAISPLVLHAAKLFVPEEIRKSRKRVVVFQSAFFEGRIPENTRQLAIWDQGVLLTTDRRTTEAESLSWMREAMIRSPNIMACVLIGGMEGVIEEGHMFRKFQPERPVFAVESTGSAALVWSRSNSLDDLNATDVSVEDESYPLVFSEFFKYLMINHLM